jgi:hypothetical protein
MSGHILHTLPPHTYPPAMHSGDALLVVLEEMQVGSILEGVQLVRITPDREWRGYEFLFWYRGRYTRVNTVGMCDIQDCAPDEQPLTFDEAVHHLRHLLTTVVVNYGHH